MTNEVLPPMIKCCDCIYSKPFKDMFNGKVRFKCQRMEQIGEFSDFYSIVDSGCVEGIKREPVRNQNDCQSAKQVLNNTERFSLGNSLTEEQENDK